MKKIMTVILCIIMMFSLAACGSNNNKDTDVTPQQSKETTNNNQQESSAGSSLSETQENILDANKENKILVAYFSRAGENYGVGVIEKGNTSIIANMIAEEVGADTFEIKRSKPYPELYDECTDEAKRELNENARPTLADSVENFDNYDVIFLGYPNWWGDMPMPVYTFLESYNFSGKTVIPFCTHAGSGLSNTESSIKSICQGATLLDGFDIPGTTAQNEQDKAKENVQEWLKDIGVKNE